MPTATPSAVVVIKEMTAAYMVSVASGTGILNYEGQEHHFTISGLGAGGAGGQKVSAIGRVYNLDNVADFAGTYRGVSDRVTLIDGTMHAKLTNGNGAEMYLAGETEGFASSLGAQEFEVTLTD